jgi:hypothetical protein
MMDKFIWLRLSDSVVDFPSDLSLISLVQSLGIGFHGPAEKRDLQAEILATSAHQDVHFQSHFFGQGQGAVLGLRDQPCGLLAVHHARSPFRNQLFSRHSRRRSRDRCSITFKLVVVMPTVVQI